MELCILIELQCHLFLQSIQSGAAGLDLLQDGLVAHDREGPHGGVDCTHAGVVLLHPGHTLGVDIRLQSQQRKNSFLQVPHGGFTTGRAKAGCQEEVLLTDGRTRSSASSSMVGVSEPSGGATRRELVLKTASSLPLFLSCFPLLISHRWRPSNHAKGCET